MSERISQQDKILARLQRGPASGMDFVLDCGVLNYGARIRELRKRYEITSTEQWKGRTRIVTYRLSEPMQQQVASARENVA